MANRFPDFLPTDPAHADVFNAKVRDPGNALDGEVQAHVGANAGESAVHGLRVTAEGIVEYYDGVAWHPTRANVDGGEP